MIPLSEPVREMQAGHLPLLFRLQYRLRSLMQPTLLGDTIPLDQQAIVPDISHYEGGVNFSSMQNAGAAACIAKCTQGTTILDSKYMDFAIQCRAIPFGDYHYMLNANGTAQADWYCAKLQPSAIPFTHWCDVELPTLQSSYIYQWAVKVKTNLQMSNYSRIGIYTSAYFWSLVVDDGYKAWCSNNLMLWVAHYTTGAPWLPVGWLSYVMHQYTPSADGHLYGCDALEVDLSRCRKNWVAQFLPQDWQHRVDAYLRTLTPPFTGPGPA